MQTTAHDSLSVFYQLHHGWLRNFLLRRLNCSETAADLAQDTFVRLLDRNQNLSIIDEPRAYLSQIAHGLMVNHWRRRDIEQAYIQALSQQPESTVISAEEHHLIIETLYRVEAMLQGLPERVRRVLIMSRVDGATYAEIAKVVGVSERMIKKYMAQAMMHCLQMEEKLVS